jgi:hypothetical protein
MHTFFLLLALVLAAAASGLGVLLLGAVPPTSRRPFAIVILLVPPAVLLLALQHLVPRFWPDCAPLVGWDRAATFGLVGLLGFVAVAAVAHNLLRLLLLERLLATCPGLDHVALEQQVAALAVRLGVQQLPVMRRLHLDAPLAMTSGLRRRTIVLSTWTRHHGSVSRCAAWSGRPGPAQPLGAQSPLRHTRTTMEVLPPHASIEEVL